MHRLLLAAAIAVVPAVAFGQGARDNIDALIEQQAKANGVPASFVHAVVKRESNYNPNAKGGSALGLMQIKHATARSLGYTGDAAGLLDPATNLRYGVAYLARPLGGLLAGHFSDRWGRRTVLLAILVVMGGRVIPFFTKNRLPTAKATSNKRLDILAISATVLAAVMAVAAPMTAIRMPSISGK